MATSAAKLTLTEEEEDLIGAEIPQAKPRPLSSLTASAERLTKKKLKRMGHRQKADQWQEDAWDMYDLVGEQRFLASTLANRMSQARFFVGKMPVDTTEDLEKIEDGPAYEAFQSMIGKGGTVKQMVQRLGVNLFIPGDGYIMGCPSSYDPDEPNPQDALGRGITPFGEEDPDYDPLADIDLEDLEWATYSTSELQVDDKTGKITVKREGKHEYDADRVVLIRVWRSHPRYWEKADSPTMSSLPVLRELVGLTMHISAQTDSRLAGAGMLLIPASADQAVRAAAGVTSADDSSPLSDAIMKAMITPISDRSNASAIVPVMPVVPDESIEKFRFISFSTPLDKEAKNLRDEAIRRLALGEDCPPELLLGVSSMNHWGAWLVREDVVTTHLEPPLAIICDAITRQFIWPVLEQQGVEDYQEFVVWYDVEHLIQRPNRAQDAKDAHTAKVIKDASLRDALGFDEKDAPEVDPTDPIIALIIEMVREAPTLAVNPGLGVLYTQLNEVIAGKAPPPAPPAQDEDEVVEGEIVEDEEPSGASQEGPPAAKDLVASGFAMPPARYTPPVPDVHVNVTVEPPEMEFTIKMPEGGLVASAAEAPVVNIQNVMPDQATPEVTVNVEPAPVQVETPVNVEVSPTPVNVEAPSVTVEAAAAPNVEITNDVQPTPVTVDNVVNVPKPRKRKTKILRDQQGKITGAETTE